MTQTASPLPKQQANQAPSRPLDAVLAGMYERYRYDHDGEVATYIPELAKANPDWFGLCLATTDGTLYSVGDTEVPFTIQSISKPFAYAMALEHRGHAEVQRRVGVEPSGEAFNSISLEPGTGRPLNPMINAGAIAVSCLIYQTYRENALDKVLEWFAGFTGRVMTLDESVYQSECGTGHRNRAIAHLLRNFDIVGDPVEPGVDLYFKQCSILVTAQDLAMMGATIGNRGINPRTGQRAISVGLVDDMLSLMTTCGMYDYAGQWLYDVGLPAKSGVAGGILAMLPGRMGIGTFSPRLDSHGNSVRGIKVCRELSEKFRLHLFSAPRQARSVIRRVTTLEHRHSQRVRSLSDTARIKSLGQAVRVFELQGDIEFDGMERVQRTVSQAAHYAGHFVLDFSRVDYLDEVATQGIVSLIQSLLSAGRHVGVTGKPPTDVLSIKAGNDGGAYVVFEDLDSAIESCEESLLTGLPLQLNWNFSDAELQPEELDLARKLKPEELDQLRPYLRRNEYAAETRIIARGDAADMVHFPAKGLVAVRRELEPGKWQTLARIGRGSVFGEMAVIDRGQRSSDIWTVTEVTSYTLSLEDYDRLNTEAPALKVKVLEHLVGVLTSRLRNANEQIAALVV
ncbi:MAG: glutaminase A [Phycisphaera sp.]|nr:glutaminase A [Phycisphaera sp.]